MAINLTLNVVRVTAQPPIPGFSSVQHADANITNHKSRIGEFKTVEFGFTADKSIYGFRLYFNPALFSNTGTPTPFTLGTPGTRYYFAQFPASGTGTIVMSYNALGALFPNIDKLSLVFVQYTSSTTFSVFIQYYQSYDFEGFLEPNIGDNHSRLLKDKKSSTTELTTTGSSVYTDTAVDLRGYFFMENSVAPTDLGYLDVNPAYGYKAGFYNEGTHGAATYFTNPVFTLSRTAGTVTSLSNVEDTLVAFKCNVPAALSAEYMVATIIRTDKTDNTVDFVTNYELEQKNIDPATVAGTKLKGPFVAPLVTGPSEYTCSFYVDKTGLVLGAKYRIIMHVYHDNFPTDYEVDAFISDEFEVNADVPYNGEGFEIGARLSDMNKYFTGNSLTCCIEERMLSELTLDLEDDYGIGTYARDIYNRLGITIPNDIRRYLTQVDFRIFSTAPAPFSGTYEHEVLHQTSYKTGATTYSKSSIIGTFTTGQAKFTCDWRNRYESGILNIDTLLAGVSQGPLSNQYWGGKSFFCEWKLTFFYDDYITPFTDEVLVTQVITVKDYGDCNPIRAQNPPDDSLEFWCPEDTMCLKSTLNPSCTGGEPSSNFYLITTIEPAPGTITTIEEHETFTPVILPVSTSSKILSQETLYSQTTVNQGKFCVDVANLLFTDYKITALAKHV